MPRRPASGSAVRASEAGAARSGDAAVDMRRVYTGVGPSAAERERMVRRTRLDRELSDRITEQSVAANASLNSVTNLIVAAPDDVPCTIRFAEIWSNPPIRADKQALHDLLGVWLPRRGPGGHAHLVVHRNLGATRWRDGSVTRADGMERVTSSRG